MPIPPVFITLNALEASSFGFNTLAIVEGKPKTCNLKDFLSNFLSFREDVVTKKTKFELKKAEERAHILLGLSVSVENLDKIIKVIRSSKTPEDAKEIASIGVEGIIVGTAFVDYIEKNLNDTNLSKNVGNKIKEFTNKLL